MSSVTDSTKLRSRRKEDFTVDEVAAVIAKLNDKVARLQKDIRVLRQSEPTDSQSDYHPETDRSRNLQERQNVWKCEIRRKRISRGVQYEKPIDEGKYQILLQCFQPQGPAQQQKQKSTKEITSKNEKHDISKSQQKRSNELTKKKRAQRNENLLEIGAEQASEDSSSRRNMDETVSETDEERDPRRYAGVAGRNRRNRPAAAPHRRSEVKVTGDDKRRRDPSSDSARRDSKSKEMLDERDDMSRRKKDSVEAKEVKKKKRSLKEKGKTKRNSTKKEKKVNKVARNTSLEAEKRRRENPVNLDKENEKNNLETAKRYIRSLKNILAETKKNDESKMKNLAEKKKEPKEKKKNKKRTITSFFLKKRKSDKTVRINEKKNSKHGDSKEKNLSVKKVKSDGSTDSQYVHIKDKLNNCAAELNYLIGKVSELFLKKNRNK